MNRQLEIATDIMLIAHKGKVDKGGEAYILHPIKVMQIVSSYRFLDEKQIKQARVVALLHDVIEDSNIERQYLRTRGIDYDLVQCVEILTRVEDETYSEFIDRICNSGSLIAMCVKLADLTHNMDKARLGKCIKKHYKLRGRYEKAYKQIIDKLKEMGMHLVE